MNGNNGDRFDNGDRFVTWKHLIQWALPTLVTVAVTLLGATLWLNALVKEDLATHARHPTHDGAVSYREFLQMREDLRRVNEKLDRILSERLK